MHEIEGNATASGVSAAYDGTGSGVGAAAAAAAGVAVVDHNVFVLR